MSSKTYLTSRSKVPKRPQNLSFEDSFFWYLIDVAEGTKPWIWQGPVGGHGYGEFSWNGRKVLAHRASYLVHFGDIPNGMIVRHESDLPLDCNPANLILGDNRDNHHDRMRRGITTRSALRGSNNPSARLTELEALEIKRLYLRSGMNQKEIAEKFSVARSLVSMIASGKAWRHLPD